MEYDFSKRMFGFTMVNPVVVSSTTGNGDPIVAYVNEWNGRQLAHIRQLYQGKNGEWCPGKQGISFPANEMVDVLLKLAERFVGDPGQVAGAAIEAAAQPERFKVEGFINKDAHTMPTVAVVPGRPDHNAKRGLDALKGLKSGLGPQKGDSVGGKQTGNGKAFIMTEPTEAQWAEFLMLAGQLSPENLTCDGELSPSQVARKRRQINAQWASLEKRVGRTVTKDEAWNHHTGSMKLAQRTVPAAVKVEKRRSRVESADKRIERLYYKHCSGVQIDIMDIAKVFKIGQEFIKLHNPTDEQLAKRIVSFVRRESFS
jgi:hypothetical protein